MTDDMTKASTGACGPLDDSCRWRIAPQSGRSFRHDDVARVRDPEGEQVSKVFEFCDGDMASTLSSGHSFDYAGKSFLTTGDTLWSNDSQPMFTIVKDEVGSHDFLLAPCSQELFEILWPRRSCPMNVENAFEPLCLGQVRLSTTFNILMTVDVGADRAVSVKAPTSKTGGCLALRAEKDLIFALTACSPEGSTYGSFKSIDFVISAAKG